MNGRATQTDLRSEKKNIAATGEPRVQARVHLANVHPLPYPFPIMVNHGQKKERRREARRGEVDGAGCGFEWRLCSCRTGDRRSEEREPAGKGGAPMVLQSAGDGGGAARRRHGEESRCDRRRWTSTWRRRRHLRRGDWPNRSTPDGAAAQRPPCFLQLQRARAQGSGGGGARGEGRCWARCEGGGATRTVEAA